MKGRGMNKYSIPRNIWRAIYPILIYLACTIGVMTIAAVAIAISVGDEETASALLDQNALLILSFSFIVGLVVFLPLWIRTKKTHEALNTGKLKPMQIVLVIATMIFYSLFATFLILCLPILEIFPSLENVVKVLSGGDLLLQLVTICLLAPLLEEFFVRGVVLNRLLTWMNPRVALLISAVIFGAIHQNLFQFINATILGLLIGYAYIKTKNLTIPILAHMTINTTSQILGLILNAAGVTSGADVPALAMSVVSLVAFAVFSVLFYRSTKNTNQNPSMAFPEKN